MAQLSAGSCREGAQAQPERLSKQDLLTLGNSTLLLGHILILLTGAYLLMGQVRVLSPPPTWHLLPGLRAR